MNLALGDYRFDLTFQSLVLGLLRCDRKSDSEILQECESLLDSGADCVVLDYRNFNKNDLQLASAQVNQISDSIHELYDVPVLLLDENLKPEEIFNVEYVITSNMLLDDNRIGEFDSAWSVSELVANQTKQITAGCRILSTDSNLAKSSRRTADLMSAILRSEQVESQT